MVFRRKFFRIRRILSAYVGSLYQNDNHLCLSADRYTPDGKTHHRRIATVRIGNNFGNSRPGMYADAGYIRSFDLRLSTVVHDVFIAFKLHLAGYKVDKVQESAERKAGYSSHSGRYRFRSHGKIKFHRKRPVGVVAFATILFDRTNQVRRPGNQRQPVRHGKRKRTIPRMYSRNIGDRG